MPNRIVAALVSLAAAASLTAAEGRFTKLTLTKEFLCEGAAIGDFNKDGKMDIAAGPFWWQGPDFKTKHEYTAPPAQPYNAEKSYSDYFLTYTHDFNADGWMDILVYSWPGKAVCWYENPQQRGGHWFRHAIMGEGDGESPDIGDVTGDGKPELLAFMGGRLGFAELDWSDPGKPSKFWGISPENKQAFFRYTHGYGYGDINGDGKADLLDKNGWWEQPKDYRAGGEWKFHKVPFMGAEGMRGGAHMLVYDVNGDGLNDVVTSWDGHGYGLAWYEQKREGGKIGFNEHVLVNTKETDNPHGVKFTQIHALVKADMNGDGLMDFVTGKRFWAHGPGKDAEPDAPAVLYWFELKRSGGKAEFIPHLIDDDSGVGTKITTGDLNGDGKPDVVSANKKGIHVFLQK
jgi:hypothetical protein